MSRLSRRGLLAGASVFAIGNRAHAAEFTYKFATNLPGTHPLNVQAAAAAERVRAASDGRLDIQLFPNNQLGSDTDMLSQLRSGALEFFTLSGLILSTLVPPSAINGIGFAFKDYDQVWAAMDGPLGAYVRAEIAKRGLIALEKIWDNGYRQITSATRPIRTPADLQGFKIRVPPSPLWTGMFKSFEAAPASINFAEVYSSLQTHIVDGQENPLAVIETAKLYEVQKYLSMTNHMWDGYWCLANRRSLEKLPADLQTLVQTEFNKGAMLQRVDVAHLNGSLAETLKAKGMEIITTEPAAFREALRKAGFYSEWKGKFGDQAWSTLEAITGPLA